ncbi:MAG: dTMP kinase [Pseudonocardia sp.]
MLIAFEGQDGAGKTSLLRAACTELTRQGVRAVVVDEFSDSPYGQRLLEAVAHDKFLRPVQNEPETMLTRVLDIVADLYYLDERVIAPALETGHVVLKDRHLDTIFYTLVPTLVEAGTSRTESRALTWLSIMLSKLLHKPTFTVFVDAPLDVRLERIQQRTRHLREDRANSVSDEDLAIFAARERIIRQLIAAEPARFLTVHNGNTPLHAGVRQVLALVASRRPQEGRSTHG